MNGVRHNRNCMREYVSMNLRECCRELLYMKDSGILPEGHVRIASRMIVNDVGSMSLSIIESEVGYQAMKRIADEKQ